MIKSVPPRYARCAAPLLAWALAACGDAGTSAAGANATDDAATAAPDAGPSADSDAARPQVDPDDGVPPPPVGDPAALYGELCANCHGPHGEGGAGPPLTRPFQATYLAEYIDARMPLGNPERCDRACAEALATYILGDLLVAPPVDCAETSQAAGPRTLRLLTRREYRNTVRDLLRLSVDGGAGGAGDATACQSLADCDVSHQSCNGGVCVDDPCETHTFVYDPSGPAGATLHSVHVAGSFNGWPGTVAGGGWPLTFDASVGRWVLKHAVPDGEQTYKLVLDERNWIADPNAAESAPDGFGGQNSVLRQQCPGSVSGTPVAAGAQAIAGLTRDVPPETRPRGYGFENHAESGVVTPNHVEAYLSAAQTVSALVLAQPGRMAPCLGTADCPETFLRDFGSRAFRRPLTDAETARYAALWRGEPSDAEGLAATVEALLSSPGFLYRSELGESQADGTFQLTPYEIATALSYTFWATMPDDTLLAAAADGTLATPDGIAAQAQRLLADGRAREQFGEVALQWLGVDGLGDKTKRADMYPLWSPALAQSMLEEARRLTEAVVFDGDGRFETLLTTQRTFVNAPLATLYGLPGAFGDTFSPADLSMVAHGPRSGVLGLAAVLATTAHSDQTSPIRRGLFVRDRLLCTVFGQPPADAGGVPDVDPSATTRERFRQHTAEPRCAACHRYIDDVGFGFERFDAIGGFRDNESGHAIDAHGNMNDVEGLGTHSDAPYDGLPALGAILAGSGRAEACFATQMWRYARGRLESPDDTCEVADVQARFQAAGGDVRALLVALTATPAFVHRRDVAEAP